MIRKNELEKLMCLSVATIGNSIAQLEKLCAENSSASDFDQATISEAVRLCSLARMIENAADSIGMAEASELRDFMPGSGACKSCPDALSSSMPDSGGFVA